MLLRNLYLTIPVIHSFIFVTSGCQGQPGGSIWVALDWEPALPFHDAQARRPGNALACCLMEAISIFPVNACIPVPLPVPQFHCGCITPKFNDNNCIAPDSVGRAFKRGSAGWLVSAPCGVSLGGSTVNEGPKMASLLCAACHLGSLISPLHGLSSSRASLFPCGLLAG